jgi:hypothetical protein
MTAFGIYAVRTSASCGVGHGFRLGTVMAKDLGKPVRILNDASIQGPDFNTATCQSRLSALIDHLPYVLQALRIPIAQKIITIP